MCKMSYDKLLHLEKKLALKLTLNIWILETSMPKYFEYCNVFVFSQNLQSTSWTNNATWNLFSYIFMQLTRFTK